VKRERVSVIGSSVRDGRCEMSTYFSLIHGATAI